MTIYAGWENVCELRWEFPLGTYKTGSNALPFAWLSDTADSLSPNAVVSARRVYGYRYVDDEHLTVNQGNPGGGLGAIPLWFNGRGQQFRVNRLLNAHFQNHEDMCPFGLNCYVAHYPMPTQPDAWHGFTVLQHYGDTGTAYRYKSGVINTMKFDWAVGKPFTITPSFLFQNCETPVEGTAISPWTTEFDYMTTLYTPPNITCTWNGTALETSRFSITSENNITPRFSTNSKTPVGFVMGEYDATLEFDVWMSDEFYSRFVDNALGTIKTSAAKVGTFGVTFSGPSTRDGTFNSYISFVGKIIEIPTISPKGRSSVQTVKMTMTGYGTGLESPFYVKVEGVSDEWW